jgi:hypothetical protein
MLLLLDHTTTTQEQSQRADVDQLEEANVRSRDTRHAAKEDHHGTTMAVT